MTERHRRSRTLARVVESAILVIALLGGSSTPVQAHHGYWVKSVRADPNNSNNWGTRTAAGDGAGILVARFKNITRDVVVTNFCESSVGTCYSVTSVYVYTPVGHRYFRSSCGRAGPHYLTGGDEDTYCWFIMALDGGNVYYGTR